MLRALCHFVVVAAVLSACGNEVYRPLRLAIRGLSARADVLVLKAFPEAELGCGQVEQNAAPSIGAPFEERWVRSEGGDRELMLPEIGGERITVLVYSETLDGTLLQFVCKEISIDDVSNAPNATILINLPIRG